MKKFVYLSQATNSNGTATVSIATPGTFTPGVFSRKLLWVEFFFGSPNAGDCVTTAQIIDANSVVPSQMQQSPVFQAQYPNYPIFRQWDDAQTSNGGILISPYAPRKITTIANQNGIPSGIVLTATGQKASTNLTDTFYVTICWDDGT